MGLVHLGRKCLVLCTGIGACVPQTYPKLGEVSVRGVIGFAMSLKEDVNDFLLLLREFGLQALLECLLLLALQYHLTLPLNLLVRQDDCRDSESIRKSYRGTGTEATPGRYSQHPHHLANQLLNTHQPHPAPVLDCGVTASRYETRTVYSPLGCC